MVIKRHARSKKRQTRTVSNRRTPSKKAPTIIRDSALEVENEILRDKQARFR
jgi:hypothetical protein